MDVASVWDHQLFLYLHVGPNLNPNPNPLLESEEEVKKQSCDISRHWSGGVNGQAGGRRRGVNCRCHVASIGRCART